jgi:hypothetical protein
MIYTKDLQNDGDTLLLPIYMTMLVWGCVLGNKTKQKARQSCRAFFLVFSFQIDNPEN